MQSALSLAPQDSAWSLWVSAASAIVAVLALLVGISNRNTARRALQLSEAQEKRRAARLTLTLEETAAWLRPDASRWLGMKILAVNPTDRESTLIGAELNVAYTLETGQSIVAKVPHAPMDEYGKIESLALPKHLAANGAVSGWLTFRLAGGLLPDGAGIDRYDAVLYDSRGISATVSSSIMREVRFGQEPEDTSADHATRDRR